ncbi:MAG: bifunctional sulfate adenylyltransferase/adenylylsulfate kinase [Oligoflexia bacterium]|nr:bifunctional sulfate adenylyltransferase/adenylylsulfate kinase [Oligoflexia bacterium]
MSSLIKPHGGQLIQLINPSEVAGLRARAEKLPSISLSHRQICDLELLLSGGFSPLTGFMTKEQYLSVLEGMQLPDGTVWPMPITLDLDSKALEQIKGASEAVLRDNEGFPLAILTISDIWEPEKANEAQRVFGTTSLDHPGVFYLMKQSGSHYVGGKLAGISLPRHYDFVELRKTPAQLRAELEAKGASKVVAFQTRNPMHRAHVELTFRAAEQIGGHLLIHPVVGMTKPGDVDHFTRVRCYKEVMRYYKPGTASLSLLPLAMRMGGPREAVWHAIIRKNHGVSHFIVGRDHAGPGKDKQGKPFYQPYEAQDLLASLSQQVGVEMVPFKNMVYVEKLDKYFQEHEAPAGEKTLQISGTELRGLLAESKPIPSWLSYPEIIKELKEAFPSNASRGMVLFFTGLPASGKSTLANALAMRLMEIDRRQITLLDGDVVRKYLTAELGFSKQDRATQVRRVGFIAAEIAKHGGTVICSLIAPYAEDRRINRDAISPVGEYLEVFVATSLKVCEERDPKGLYAKARKGQVTGFTGIDDPYEAPERPELHLDMGTLSISDGVDKIVSYLRERGFITAQ